MRAATLAALTPLVLVACSPDPGIEAPDSDESSTATAPEASTQVMGPGLYAVGDETTIYARTRLLADGTYTDLDTDMNPVGAGKWEQRGPLMCFDPEGDGEDQQERCWTNSEPAEDGSFTTTRVDGEGSYRVTPLERP